MAATYAGYFQDTAVTNTTPPTLIRSTIVNVYLPNTTTAATLYSSRDKSGTVNSITTDEDGFYSFYATPGYYDVKIGTKTRRVKVSEDDADTISPDQINAANGVAGLDANATLPASVAPTSGWPKTSLASTVQNSLTKADTAMQLTTAVQTSLQKADTAVQPSTALTASLAKADSALQQSTPAAFESKVGTVVAYTFTAADNGKIIGFGSGGSAAITVTVPNNLPVGWNVGIVQEGPGRITVVAGSGATVANRQSFYATAGFLAFAGVFVRYNASGTQAAAVVYGDVAAA